MTGKKPHKAAVYSFALAFSLVLICSCLSFNIGDKPSPFVYPQNSPAANWCGTIGAFCAYYLMYYVGPGVFAILLSAVCFLALRLAGLEITQPILRTTGVILLAAALSISAYVIKPQSADGFPMGNGGIVGIGAGFFLKTHLAGLGTMIVVVCAWIVGAILLADSLVVTAARWCAFCIAKLFGSISPAWSATMERSRNLTNIWRKLNARQKQLTSSVLNRISERNTESEDEFEFEEDTEAVTAADEAVESKLIPAKAAARPAQTETAEPYVSEDYQNYQLPSLELLSEPVQNYSSVQEKIIKSQANSLELLLAEFNVNAHVVGAEPGPVITMFELELAPGIKVSQISNLANDMARGLSAPAVRVVAPLPGRHTIGIEVPNHQKEIVKIKGLIQQAGSRPDRMHLPLFLGKDSAGESLVSDLTAMPHLLIAGTTGSGKSVCINSIITSILMTKQPDEAKLILIDPKMVEMTAFNDIPHLMCPIVTEIRRAEQILEWATTKMDERYSLLAEAGVKNVAAYNKLGEEEILKRFAPTSPEEAAQIPKKIPYIVIIVDELADLMMTAAKEIEAYIVRLAQKSRAIGIHIVLATQRPQATVVTGLIKSNLPTRVGFRVAAKMDSRIILDQNGAETLLGQGDMLFLKPGTSELVRAQGTFIDDREVKAIVNHLKNEAEPSFHPELMQLNRMDASQIKKDELFDEAVRIVLETHRGSVSLLQRKLSIGYARASRIIEMMASSGVLGQYKGSQAREVLITLEQYEQLCKQVDADERAGYTDLTESDDEEEYEYETDEDQKKEYEYEDENQEEFAEEEVN